MARDCWLAKPTGKPADHCQICGPEKSKNHGLEKCFYNMKNPEAKSKGKGKEKGKVNAVIADGTGTSVSVAGSSNDDLPNYASTCRTGGHVRGQPSTFNC